MCHSDIHQARDEWGGDFASNCPCLPGHEIAGVVAKVGSEVTQFAVGDRAGVGCCGVNFQNITAHRQTVAGSLIGGIAETQEVLQFCVEHDISPRIEIISIERINKAFDDVVANNVRFRYVIDSSTLHKSA